MVTFPFTSTDIANVTDTYIFVFFFFADLAAARCLACLFLFDMLPKGKRKAKRNEEADVTKGKSKQSDVVASGTRKA